MTTQAHDIGDQRRFTGTFTDIDGNAADPSSVTFTLREPDGTLITKTGGEVSNPAVGTFHYDHTIAKPGRHTYRFEGAGAVIAAGETEFWARHRHAV